MKGCNGLLLFLGCLVSCSLCSNVVSREGYLYGELTDLCPRDGSKLEVEIGSKALILTLKQGLKESLNCHLEIETFTNFGLHVYMAEMALDGNESGDECQDFVQFARDLFTFTTHRSARFCGRRHALNFSSDQQLYRTLGMRGDSRQRLYIEEKDREMDVWLGVSPDVANAKNLTLVITPFKKSCASRDTLFRRCHPSRPYCIRQEYFCDHIANCAWPSGDRASDERQCDGYDSYSGSSSSFGLAHLPLTIIGVIVVLGTLLLVCVALRHVWEMFGRPHDPDSQLPMRRRDRPNDVSSFNDDPTLRRHESPLLTSPMRLEELQQRPPTYEEAVKLEASGSNEMPSAPPPYQDT